MASPSASAAPRRIVLLGATGSVGESTLRVIAAHRDKLELVGIAARVNHARLAQIARDFAVPHAAIFDDRACAAAKTSGAFPPGTQLHGGLAGLIALAQLPAADVVLVAVVGTTGLEPALAALAAGKDLALASKEILVLAGKFVITNYHKVLRVNRRLAALGRVLEKDADGSVKESAFNEELSVAAGFDSLADFRRRRIVRIIPVCPSEPLKGDLFDGFVDQNLTRAYIDQGYQDPNIYNLLGYSLRKTGDRKGAESFYLKALDFDPDHKGTLEYQGELYIENGDLPKAKQNLARLETLCPAGCEERADLEAALTKAAGK